MKSQTTLKDNNHRGFSLIEIMIGMAVISLIFLAGYFTSTDSFSRELIISENLTLVSVLQKARNSAMNNIYAHPHGVHIEEDAYVIFRVSPYDTSEPTNERIPRNSKIAISGLEEVIFAQLSGEPDRVGDFIVSDGLRTKKVSVIKGGLISW